MANRELDDLFDMDPDEGQLSNQHSPSNSLTSVSSNPSSQPEAFAPTFGEHPLGEHPSRTLFVRNINSGVDDEELNSLFEVSFCDYEILIHC
jgi:RNA recognition motif-containing protein